MKFTVAAAALGALLAPQGLVKARKLAISDVSGQGGGRKETPAAPEDSAIKIGSGSAVASTSSLSATSKESLRGRRLVYGFDCGCPTTCTEQALDAYGGQYKCGARINFLVSEGWARGDACRLVAGVEFPTACGGCDPLSCPQDPVPTPSPTPSPSPCGCGTCTPAVLSTDACDQDGCHSCGGRLNWLMNDAAGPLLPEYDACVRLARDEFPEGPCGPACDPTSCNEVLTDTPTAAPTSNPTEVPTSAPTAAPTSAPTSDPTSVPTTALPSSSPTPAPPVADPPTAPSAGPSAPCGCATCTPEVLDRYAGAYKCSERIDWLQSVEGGSHSELAACGKVAGDEFPDECGPCGPATCNPVYLPDIDQTKLVWFDEFDTDGPLDSTKWTYDTGGNGWGNAELQHYTDRTENSYVSNGVLHIRAVREYYEGNDFTSARAVTRGLGDWTYGRIRVRARLERCTGLGTWPAIWMLPTDWAYGGWPLSGEIDIMEHVGYDTGRVHGTVHTDAFNHMRGTQVGKSLFTNVADWHVYEIVWDTDKIEFAMDGIRYHEFTRIPPPEGSYREWPFDQQFHLILNVAVGGTWGGAQGVDSSTFEGDGQIMEVDWVRVYSL